MTYVKDADKSKATILAMQMCLKRSCVLGHCVLMMAICTQTCLNIAI